ncbi:ead/Ea22-like family protein [Salmonella enterica]|uniref:Ead/Ea22-like family protein n=3 Tax=Salmonella enterica TaxID=28901 RepID=A0A2A6D6L0_SALER|nr:ead/Ea22-like family protein [Salmonella enterica]EBP6759589.1 ead/Ea22-like family protein [Salmonella enterica subsp. enterica]ECB4859621.1 ead/Ea22-like family protein [Salmonella enterica subsp. enterica serovar Lexington]EDC0805242.1 ead/Ea22-like family protein [Salmonella enterica subsp. enterica serovar Senftenberg]EDI1547200.1 ead/Ea22-like family protein [Salmonella enterica subsp. enterica serovar Muenster]EDX1669608.1 ead/Ea22-like family protein [Salmonella enterica subsp. ente
MTALNKQALREAAEKAGKDKWQAKKINGDFYVIRSGSYIKQCGITSYQPIAEIDHKPVRDFVAMVNPATTLALLDENLQLQREKDAIEAVTLALRDDMRQAREQLEAAEKRIAEQREYYEGVIADGSKRIAELEAKLETADRLHDSAFRDGLKAGFSYGQTDDQSGFTQCMSAYNTTPASLLPDGLIRAVHFYEQVKRENPPVETGAWKDAIDWVLKEACLAASTLESSREHEAISQQEKA